MNYFSSLHVYLNFINRAFIVVFQVIVRVTVTAALFWRLLIHVESYSTERYVKDE